MWTKMTFQSVPLITWRNSMHHPFREGNGRTQRELINQLAYSNGLFINWKTLHPQEILEATIQSFHGHYENLERLIWNNLE